MIKQAILGRLHFELEDSLFDEIAAIRGGDPFGEITVVAGSNILCAYLKKELARRSGGFFNVRFITFADLVYRLSAGGSKYHRASLPPFADAVIARGIAGSSTLPACFREVAGMRGFTAALLATFDDLAEASCDARQARSLIASTAAGLQTRVGGLLSLYAGYRERLERGGADVHAFFEDAIEAARDALFAHPLLAYGFYDFNELQWRLMAAIGDTSGAKLFMPWREHEESYRFASRTADMLSKRGFELVKLEGTGGGAGARRVRLFSAPGMEEEVREIVRRILGLVAAHGIGFGEIAVLLPARGSYAPIVRAVLEEAAVPFFASGYSVLEEHAAARAALRLLDLLRDKIERRTLVEFLVSAPLTIGVAGPLAQQRDIEAPFDPFQVWVRASAEAGMMGSAGWLEENAALAHSLEQALGSGVSERQDGEIRDTLWSTRLVSEILRRITEVRNRLASESHWSGFATIIADLVRDIFEPSEGLDIVCAVIDDLKKLDCISNGASFELFSHILDSALAAPTQSKGRFAGGGVHVLPLGQARGCAFRAVFIPGLCESITPGKVVQDPFLLDHERRRIGAMSGGAVRLSEKSDRIEEEALLFALALDSGREEVVCSYPRSEEDSGKQMMPSSFLRFVPAYTPGGPCGESLVCERLSRIRTKETVSEPASEREYDFFMARGYKRGSGILPADPLFRRVASLIDARWGKKKFTPYDGVFASASALGELKKILDDRGWRFSPTAMERYAGCPFNYFLNNVLGIEPTEEPERLITITPLQRGELVHRILARLFSELQKLNLLPLAGQTTAQAREIAERVTAREAAEYPKNKPVGLPVFWEMEKRMIAEAVSLVVDEDIGEGDEFVPAFFERSFGMEGESVQVQFVHGERTFRFQGRIDRIDVGPQERFRVIDFKTGRLDRKDQDFAGGSNLQLPVYLLAASRILGRPIQSGEAMYRRVGVSAGKRTVEFSGARWEETERELGAIIAVITGGIENGIFFAPAEDRSCSFCDMRSACTTGRSGIFESKAKHDARALAYLGMRTEGEVEDGG